MLVGLVFVVSLILGLIIQLPGGSLTVILDSIVKARYRNSYEKEEFLTPAQPYPFEIDLGHTAIVLAPGHRLRMTISSSSSAAVGPNLRIPKSSMISKGTVASSSMCSLCFPSRAASAISSSSMWGARLALPGW